MTQAGWHRMVIRLRGDEKLVYIDGRLVERTTRTDRGAP